MGVNGFLGAASWQDSINKIHPGQSRGVPLKKKLWAHYDSTAYLVFLVAKADNGAVLIPAVRLKGEDASAVVSHATQNSS